MRCMPGESALEIVPLLSLQGCGEGFQAPNHLCSRTQGRLGIVCVALFNSPPYWLIRLVTGQAQRGELCGCAQGGTTGAARR